MKASNLKLVTLMGAAALALGLTNSAAAGSLGTGLTVQTAITANCTISTGAVTFANYDPVGTNATNPDQAQGTVTVNCTSGSTGTWISLDGGLNAGGAANTGSRAMSNGSGGTLPYHLYLPSSMANGATCTYPGTTEWGVVNGTDTLQPSTPWSGSAQTFNVCGEVAAGQTAPVGTYTDTVQATVNF